MDAALRFQPGDLVRARGREWVVLPETRPDLLKLRPLGGAEDDAELIYLPLEPEPPAAAAFDPPDPAKPGPREAALLLWDALRLKLRAGAGPFRSFGNLNVEPRAYQLAPLLMALKLDTVRLLIADDVGIGKTIEAGLIARELIDRGEIERTAVICPPHLCEQWQQELAEKFAVEAEIVRTGTAARLERGLRPDESVFEAYAHTVVSLDYIKSDRRRDDFLRACPNFVIVDEAHACVRANTGVRHQRYRLLKGLAESKPRRHMVLLTATPHSGDDAAFHNLLALLDPEFARLAELPEGEERSRLRGKLAAHFIQRRRNDIADWNDAAGFPRRESREAPYKLTGDWGRLFDEAIAYARAVVRRAEGGSMLQQRMSWWTALALLRCVSSSPAAASLALRTRLQAAEQGGGEQRQIADLDRIAGETVMDEAEDDASARSESVPAGALETPDDAPALRRLIDRADALRGPRNDPKLRLLIAEIGKLLADGFRPVVFCRYIATAHYVGEELRKALPPEKVRIAVVTGELTSERRDEQVEALGGGDGEGDGAPADSTADSTVDPTVNSTAAPLPAPLLTATDCLSEGVNLQRWFNAVVHYDLNWNPTRHEQREGRADRFGQPATVVRALMLYGENNPVDGAVLQVILRKAAKIRKELGVAVPLPADNNKVVEAVMKAVLLRSGGVAGAVEQHKLDFGQVERETDAAWRTAQQKMKRTIFSQQKLRPGEAAAEWRKASAALGGQQDVERFLRAAAARLGAPLDRRNGCSRLPAGHLPQALRDRLAGAGFPAAANVAFAQPAPAGAIHVHRAHPLVAAFADYTAERALDEGNPEIGARCYAAFVRGLRRRTALYLLRLRSRIVIEQRGEAGGYAPLKDLPAEECLGVAVRAGAEPEPLNSEAAFELLSLEPARNMADGQKTLLIQQALAALPALESAFNDIARQRAEELLADHARIREASRARGLRCKVEPSLPADKIGVYVLMPAAGL